MGLERAYVNLTDALTMLGRPRESARLAAGGARGDAPVRDRQHRARRELDRGAARDRRLGRGRERSAPPRCARITVELPVHAPHAPRRRRDRPRRLRGRASAPRGRERHAARGPRARPLRRLPRRARPLGAPLDGRRRGRPRRSGAGTPRARPPRSASSSAPRDCAHRRSWQRSHAPAGTPTPLRDWLGRARKLLDRRPPRRRARPRRSHRTPTAGAPWPRPSTSAPAATPRPEPWSDAAATWERLERPPLAAYCRWRQAEALVAAGASRAEASVPLREAHAVAARIGAKPLLPRARAARRTRAARSRAAGRRARRTRAGPGGDPRPDAARGGGADARRPRLHEPRDRRDARDQRQDGERPRLAHPAQARRAEPARGGRDRAPIAPDRPRPQAQQPRARSAAVRLAASGA